MDICPSRGTSLVPLVPQLRSPLPPSAIITSARCFQKGYLACIHPAWSLFVILSMCPSTVHFADTRPHSLPPSPTRPSPTQASSAVPVLSIVELIMHRHVRVAFFRFPFVNLSHITSHLLVAFFTDDALNPPSSARPPHPRRHLFVAGIAISTSGHHFYSSSNHHRGPLFYVADDRSKLPAEHAKHAHNASDSQRNSNPNSSRTHQHHCERFHDYATTMTPPDIARPLL